MKPPFAHLKLAPAAVEVERRSDGAILLRSPQALRPYARCIGEFLARWAKQAPDRPFLAERAGSNRRRKAAAFHASPHAHC